MSTSQMPIEQARALALLAEGATGQEAAKQSGLTLGRIVQLARRQGWTIHPTTGLAKDPAAEDGKPVLPDDVAAVAEDWSPLSRIVVSIDQDAEDEASVDDLLADARDCDDRQVQAALARAETAIGKLRGLYVGVAERLAEDRRREAERQQALAEVAELERKLAEARQRARDAGAKPARTSAKASPADPSKPTDKQLRAWAAENGVACKPVGRVGPAVRQAYEDAHRAVAS